MVCCEMILFVIIYCRMVLFFFFYLTRHPLRTEGTQLAKEKKRLALNYLKNLSDLCVATQSAGFTARFSEGWLGVCGLISALVGAYELWPRS